MTTPECSCADYAASRRAFLRAATAAAGGAALWTIFGDTFRQTAFGATDANVLVALSLRGGADSLSMVVPHGDGAYGQSRPNIAVPVGSLLARDAMFGLHPGFRPLEPMWTSGRMAAVLATGLPQPNRSHFSAIEEVEDADLGSDARIGWINRLIGLDSTASPLEAVAVGSGVVPTSMLGPQPALATNSIGGIDLAGGRSAEAQRARRLALQQLWGRASGALADGVRSSLTTTATLAPTLRAAYVPSNGARYPSNGLGSALRDSARLIKARVGVQAVALDYGTWDMHSAVGPVDAPYASSMNGMVSNLSSALAAFFQDLGSEGSRVTLVTLTEFGRRVKENGSRGLDHGWANATLVMGGGVRGGRYYGRWPGLAYDALVNGDLAVTTDYRSVLSEILSKRFDASIPTVFPQFTPKPVGVIA